MAEFLEGRTGLRGSLALFGTYVFSMSVVFRVWIVSGFDLGFGDRADGLIEVSLLEHWRNVFVNAGVWNRPLYFYPYLDTLGYNDGYFLFGVFYSIWRSLFDPFVADMLNCVTLKTIGFFGSYLLCKRSLSIKIPTSLLVAIIFTISNGLMVQAGHAQLQSVCLVPVAFIVAIRIFRLVLSKRFVVASWNSAGLAALLAAWFVTSFYMAWFTVVFGLLFGAYWILVSPHPEGRLAQCLKLLRITAAPLAAFALTFLLLLTPFLIAYLPKLSETGGHDFSEVAYYLVWPFDLTNVGRGNYMWGWIYRGLKALAQYFSVPGAEWPENKLGGEHVSGFPLLLFSAVVASAARAVSKRSRDWISPALRAFALAIVIGWACTIQLGWFSPWHLVYLLVPGAHGLRVVLRYQLFLVLPALLLVALVQRERIGRTMALRPLFASTVIALLVIEQFGAIQSAELSRSKQVELMSMPSPPKGCTTFYVVKARRNEEVYHDKHTDAIYPHNVDAMFLAEYWRVPTINGLSTFNPPDWDFANPTSQDYDERVLRYAQNHSLMGLCRFDARSTRPWQTPGPPSN